MTTLGTTYRRKNDDLASPLPDSENDLPHHAAFTSAISSYSTIQRRGRGGSSDARPGAGLGGGQSGASTLDWANGWRDDDASAEENIWDNEPSTSSSTSSLDRSRAGGPSTRSLANGLMSSPSHPLSTPSRSSPRERWSHEELGSGVTSRPASRRTNSDDSYARRWTRTFSGKGKGRMAEEELEVIVHQVCQSFLHSSSPELTRCHLLQVAPTDSLAGVALKYGVTVRHSRTVLCPACSSHSAQ